MSQHNVTLVRAIYAAFAQGDIPSVLGAMHADVDWREAEGFIYADGNPYCGPDAVLAGVFARLGSEWDGFEVVPQDYLDAGDRVVSLGRYRGTYRATGRRLDAEFAHVWSLGGGKVAAFRQFTDTRQAAGVAGAG